MRSMIGCVLITCALAGAHEASARSLDPQRAEEVATFAASALGQVDQMDCWRAHAAVHGRRPQAAICAGRIRLASGAGCFVFYELALARKPAKGMRITRRWRPWCTSTVRGRQAPVATYVPWCASSFRAGAQQLSAAARPTPTRSSRAAST
jgi:hypothetical protein